MAIIHVTNFQMSSSASNSKRFSIDSVKLTDDVTQVKEEVAKRLNVLPNDFELIYCGRLIKQGESLQSQNIKSGVTLHVLKSVQENKEQPTAHKMDSTEIQQLVTALRTAVMNPAFRETIQRLSKAEALENLIAATPGLAEDPIAIAILQDIDLILQLTDVNNINKVVEAHPALAEAANQIAAAVHEDGGSESSSSAAAQMLASAYLYSLDAISDEDDDMDIGQMEGGRLPFGAFPEITQAQLASALAAVGPSSSSQGNSSSLITPELFSQAMQEAISATSNEINQTQLQQLRDMGIDDEALSLRALQMTGGDVHAALELIFGDFSDLSPRNSSNNPN